jgi:CheY-like chemotaxis protein
MSCCWLLDCRQQSLEAGLEHHLAKPVDPQTLQEFMVAPAKQLSTR